MYFNQCMQCVIVDHHKLDFYIVHTRNNEIIALVVKYSSLKVTIKKNQKKKNEKILIKFNDLYKRHQNSENCRPREQQAA